MTPHLQITCFIDVMDGVADRPAPVILIVEDDPFLRMLAVEFVNEAGFETLEAGDADQAIAILESRSEIAVLFTDINMPGSMDGLELALVVSNRWPAWRYSSHRVMFGCGRPICRRTAAFSGNRMVRRR